MDKVQAGEKKSVYILQYKLKKNIYLSDRVTNGQGRDRVQAWGYEVGRGTQRTTVIEYGEWARNRLVKKSISHTQFLSCVACPCPLHTPTPVPCLYLAHLSPYPTNMYIKIYTAVHIYFFFHLPILCPFTTPPNEYIFRKKFYCGIYLYIRFFYDILLCLSVPLYEK